MKNVNCIVLLLSYVVMIGSCSVKSTEGSNTQPGPQSSPSGSPGLDGVEIKLNDSINYLSNPVPNSELPSPFTAESQAKLVFNLAQDTVVRIGELKVKSNCPQDAINAGPFLTIKHSEKVLVTTDRIRQGADALALNADVKIKLAKGIYEVIPTFYTNSNCSEVSTTLSLVDAEATQTEGPVSQPNPEVPSAPTTPVPPLPELDPSQVEPIIAHSLKDIRYAYCSAQGVAGVLLDFSGVDVSQVTGAGAKLKSGMRACGSGKPFKWSEKNFYVDVWTGGNQVFLKFDMERSGSGSRGFTIDISTRNLEEGRSGDGMIYGNSGPCKFLENKGTKGLFPGGFYCE
jgi:hypothetical protein